MYCCIYAIINIINSKIYIGSSINVKKRLIQHKSDLSCNRHCNYHLQNAWNKYGGSSFIFKILLYCDKKRLSFYEQQAIDVYKTFDNKFGYNICPAERADVVGDNALKRNKKISESNSGENNPMAKSITINGKYYGSIMEAANDFNLSNSSLMYRLKNNIPLDKSKGGGKPIIINGKYYSCIKELAKDLNINYQTLMYRLKNNIPLNKLTTTNSMAKSIEVNGKHYNCIKELAKDLNINYQTLIYRLKNKVRLDKKVCNKGQFNKEAKAIIANGKYYPTITAAAKNLSVDHKTIRYRIKTGKTGYSFINVVKKNKII